MIEENAVVKSVSGSQFTIHTVKQSACGGCKESASCSTSTLSKYFGNKEIELVLSTKLPVKVGDSVVVGIEEQAILRLTVFIYLLPILVMFLCAIVGGYLQQFLQLKSELIIIFFALSGLFGTFYVLKACNVRWFDPNKLNPVVLKIN